MATPSQEAVALLDAYSHRMPMRADQIRAVASALDGLRRALGDDAPRSPHYQKLLRLLRAHARPMPDADVSFAQVQAVRLQMLATRLLAERKPFPVQLSAAIRQGLVAGFDPNTGAQLPPGRPAAEYATVGAPAGAVTTPQPWAERRLPVRRVDMAAVAPTPVDAQFLLQERERALQWRMAVTDEEVSQMLREHEAALAARKDGGEDGALLDMRTAALLEGRKRHVALVGLQRTMRARVLEEMRMAEGEGRRGSKARGRTLKQMQKEHEKLERARVRREEAEEREQRKHRQVPPVSSGRCAAWGARCGKVARQVP
jgi:hypothetical protein